MKKRTHHAHAPRDIPWAATVQASASPPAEAVVFVRTFGDVTIDVTSDWEGPCAVM